MPARRRGVGDPGRRVGSCGPHTGWARRPCVRPGPALRHGVADAAQVGVATRSSPPPPPEVGECGDVRGGQFVAVDCADVHTAEVTHGWQPDDPESGSLPSFSECADKARVYVGSAPAHSAEAHQSGEWSMPLRYRAVIVSGPGSGTYPDWSWRACLVAPLGPAPWRGYRGTVRSLPATGPTAAALRACYAERSNLSTIIPCSVAHLGEIVATRQSASGAGNGTVSSAAEKESSCADVAATLTGAVDPTFGGVLRIVVLPESGTDFPAPLSADTGVYYTSEQRSEWSICAIESAVDRRLLDSVAGSAGRSLPFE